MPVRLLFTLLLVLASIGLLVAQGRPTQSPRELFERARMLEESNSKLAEAAALYAQVAGDSSDRQLAATAQLRIGLLYERLGRREDAQRAFRRVIDQYEDQAAVAKQARARLDAGETTGARKGMTVRRVWSGSDGQFFGSPSPDGRYISFVDWISGDIALREVATGRPRTLASTRTGGGGRSGLYSRISPRGTEIAFSAFDLQGAAQLYIASMDSARREVILANPQLSYIQPFDWSADGQQILALLGRPDRTSQIAVIGRTNGAVRVLKTLDWRQPRGMSFSPDGRWIVYDFPPREQQPERDVFVLASDGSRESPLISHPDDDYVLGWVPDGKQLLFASNRAGAVGIWSLPMRDGAAAGVPSLIRADLGPRLYPLGFTRAGAFHYFIATVVSDVHTASLDADGHLAGVPQSIAGRYAGENEEADWSPDGRTLATIRQAPGSGAGKWLVLRNLESGAESEVRPDLGHFSWLRWSPDGTSIMVSGRDRRTRPGLFRIDVRTAAVSDLLRPDAGVRNSRAEWSADGQSIFYVRKSTTCSCVVRRELATGHEVEVYRMPPSGLQVRLAVAPNGQSIAVLSSAGGQPTLRILPSGGGASRVLYEGDDLAWLSFVGWTPDSQRVLFGRQRSSLEVWTIPAAGGQPTRTGLAMQGLRDLRMSPRGDRVVFTAGEDTFEVWVMEHFLPVGGSASTSPAARR